MLTKKIMYNAKAKSPMIVNGIVLFNSVFLSSIMNSDTDASVDSANKVLCFIQIQYI